jgi:preprotein translocase subunit SecE
MASGTDATEQANRAGIDPLRLVVIFLLLAGLVVGLFLAQVLSAAFFALGISDPMLVEGLDESRLTWLLSFLIAAAVAIWVFANARTKALATDVASELMKVTWPSWAETRASTSAVVVASVVAAVILFAIDNIALRLMVEWLPALWARL